MDVNPCFQLTVFQGIFLTVATLSKRDISVVKTVAALKLNSLCVPAISDERMFTEIGIKQISSKSILVVIECRWSSVRFSCVCLRASARVLRACACAFFGSECVLKI